MADRGCVVYSDLVAARFVEAIGCSGFPITNYVAAAGTNYTALAPGVTSFTPPAATPKTGFAVEGAMMMEITVTYEDTAEVIKKDGQGNVCYRRRAKKSPKAGEAKLTFCKMNLEAMATIGANRLYTAAGITTGYEVLKKSTSDYPFWWSEFYRHVDYGIACDAATPDLNRVIVPSVQWYPANNIKASNEVPDTELTGQVEFVKLPVTGYKGPWGDIPAANNVFASGVAGIYGVTDETAGATPPPSNCTGLINV